MFPFLTSPSEPSERASASRSSLFRSPTAAASFWQLKPTYLEFEDLAEFDRVEHQYSALGIEFMGAIAIQPSNPIFIPSSGRLVLMPHQPKRGIAIQFCQPVSLIKATVVGTQPVTLTACDRKGAVISQVSIGTYQYVWAPEPEQLTPLPQQELQLTSAKIAAVAFTSDAPFTLDNFFFG